MRTTFLRADKSLFRKSPLSPAAGEGLSEQTLNAQGSTNTSPSQRQNKHSTFEMNRNGSPPYFLCKRRTDLAGNRDQHEVILAWAGTNFG